MFDDKQERRNEALSVKALDKYGPGGLAGAFNKQNLAMSNAIFSLPHTFTGFTGVGVPDNAPMNPDEASYAKGGLIEGPGTGTSDSIQEKIPVGGAIIPADVVKLYGQDYFDKLEAAVPDAGGGKEKVTAKISNGEFQLSPEAVAFWGKDVINKLIGSDNESPKEDAVPGEEAKEAPQLGLQSRASSSAPQLELAEGGVVNPAWGTSTPVPPVPGGYNPHPAAAAAPAPTLGQKLFGSGPSPLDVLNGALSGKPQVPGYAEGVAPIPGKNEYDDNGVPVLKDLANKVTQAGQGAIDLASAPVKAYGDLLNAVSNASNVNPNSMRLPQNTPLSANATDTAADLASTGARTPAVQSPMVTDFGAQVANKPNLAQANSTSAVPKLNAPVPSAMFGTKDNPTWAGQKALALFGKDQPPTLAQPQYTPEQQRVADMTAAHANDASRAPTDAEYIKANYKLDDKGGLVSKNGQNYKDFTSPTNNDSAIFSSPETIAKARELIAPPTLNGMGAQSAQQQQSPPQLNQGPAATAPAPQLNILGEKVQTLGEDGGYQQHFKGGESATIIPWKATSDDALQRTLTKEQYLAAHVPNLATTQNNDTDNATSRANNEATVGQNRDQANQVNALGRDTLDYTKEAALAAAKHNTYDAKLNSDGDDVITYAKSGPAADEANLQQVQARKQQNNITTADDVLSNPENYDAKYVNDVKSWLAVPANKAAYDKYKKGK